MIEIKSEKEINIMRNNGKIMKEIQKEVKRFIKPGISTWELNNLIKNIIEKNGARSAEYNYPNFHKGKPAFPGHACISVNEQIIHGVPSKKVILKDGDIVTIDLVIEKDGYHVDMARTYEVGQNVNKSTKKLLEVTRNAFYEGIKFAKVGYRIGDISHAIESYVQKNGFDVILEYQGHGIRKKYA
jgi:methionine aminopeptidase, type I